MFNFLRSPKTYRVDVKTSGMHNYIPNRRDYPDHMGSYFVIARTENEARDKVLQQLEADGIRYWSAYATPKEIFAFRVHNNLLNFR